jgi:nitroimidazol reductase NimA-like FMN-containing flavoprotein (pyridoxamine 5'-phosphate oxidase superfamily)
MPDRASALEPEGRLTELPREECLRRLARGAAGIGRIAVAAPGWPPVIRPVNYGFDEASQAIVFRSARGSKLTALLLAEQVAFEIDGAQEGDRLGWSVVVVGSAEEVTNAAERERLEKLGVRPWSDEEKPHWLRIRTTVVSGRAIVR